MTSTFMASISAFLLPTTDVFSTLEVTHGLHRGVALPVEQPVCRIGSSRHADVMLSDDAVAAEHATLRFHARMVAIEAVGGDIEVNGKHLAQGTGWRTDLPVTLVIGGARLQLARPELSLPPAVRVIQDVVTPRYRAVRGAATDALQTARKTIPAALEAVGSFVSPAIGAIHRALSPYFQGVRRFVSPAARRLGTLLAPVSRWIRGRVRTIPLPERWRERLMPSRDAAPRALVKRGAAVTAVGMAIVLIGIYQLVGVDKAGASISASALNSTAILHPQAAEAATRKAPELGSSFGAYTQSIPIAVPPYRGLEPKVALTYSSSAGNGFVGVGWNLAGVSFIDRGQPRRGAPVEQHHLRAGTVHHALNHLPRGLGFLADDRDLGPNQPVQ